ncbi:MAG: M48 family peptidase, partial [Streptomyces sp.]|nr:M48 family peptidase [Streptomyces sp.]
MADTASTDADFTPSELARGRALRRDRVPWALGGQLVALGWSAVLGFSAAGAGLVGAVGGWFGGSWA